MGAHGGFQAREREIEVAAVQHRTGQLERGRVARFGQAREVGAAGIGQTHQLGGLIKGFTSGVVHRFAQHLVAPHPVDTHQLGVAAGHEQGDEGELGRIHR